MEEEDAIVGGEKDHDLDSKLKLCGCLLYNHSKIETQSGVTFVQTCKSDK